MAQCVQSVHELIPDSFVPCVAALCSDDAERLTRLNHLSFAELLKPFTRLTSEGTWSAPGSPGVRARGRPGGRRGRAGGERAVFTSPRAARALRPGPAAGLRAAGPGGSLTPDPPGAFLSPRTGRLLGSFCRENAGRREGGSCQTGEAREVRGRSRIITPPRLSNWTWGDCF